jgi:tetratricopeptide (TPR) repeat protein
LNSLLATENFKDAEKLAERHSKAHPQAYRFKVDIGRVMLRAGDDSKANKHFDRIIKDLDKASINQILDVGRSFAEMNENQRALDTYYAGRKLMGDSYPFNFQIAQILGEEGDVEGMVGEYLDVLNISNGYIHSVQNTLNRIIGFEEDNKYNDVLQSELLKRIQKNPNEDIYSEMLIWMYMKQNKFGAALAQVKALDKRNKEDGERVMELADLAFNNFKYGVAIEGYTYLRDKGPRSYYYIESITGLLRSYKARVTETEYDQASIAELVTEYETALNELGYQASTSRLINDLAHIKAFYESRYRDEATFEAVQILVDALKMNGLTPIDEAHLKIQLADIYVLSSDIWDASLLYGQVEKKFKYDELGHQAKLKNALVFYYAGDFRWSQAQLDVLKGSTSKLISNDAVELSAFITENLGIDSNMEALSAFAKMELMVAQHKYDSAMTALEAIEKAYPGHDLGDNILFKRAEILFEQGEYELAAQTYLKIAEDYPFGILVDNAIMQAAKISELQLKDTEKAMALYELILTDHTGSLFVIEARKRFRMLRGDKLQ